MALSDFEQRALGEIELQPAETAPLLGRLARRQRLGVRSSRLLRIGVQISGLALLCLVVLIHSPLGTLLGVLGFVSIVGATTAAITTGRMRRTLGWRTGQPSRFLQLLRYLTFRRCP